MPYRWTETSPEAPKTLLVWPHRSLPARGFVWFIGLTAALLSLPLLAALGSPTLWALLPFLIAAVAGIWVALRRNARDRSVTETLTLTRDMATLVRREPDPGDARARRIVFTATGLDWLAAFRDAVAQAEAEFRAAVGPEVATVVALGLEAYAA